MSDVFISYKREDRERARAIAKRVAASGFDVWWDVDLLAGQNFADEINSVVNKSKAVVVLWTPNSVQSNWVRAETALAMNRGTLVPVWLEKTDLPIPYNTLHTYDLTGWSGDVDDERLLPLLDAVYRIVGQPDKEKLNRSQEEIDEILDEPTHEVEFWTAVANSSLPSISEYEAYLDRYGDDGAFAKLARLRMADLSTEKSRRGAEARLSLFGIQIPIPFSVGVPLIVVAAIVWGYWNRDEVCARFEVCVATSTSASEGISYLSREIHRSCRLAAYQDVLKNDHSVEMLFAVLTVVDDDVGTAKTLFKSPSYVWAERSELLGLMYFDRPKKYKELLRNYFEANSFVYSRDDAFKFIQANLTDDGRAELLACLGDDAPSDGRIRALTYSAPNAPKRWDIKYYLTADYLEERGIWKPGPYFEREVEGINGEGQHTAKCKTYTVEGCQQTARELCGKVQFKSGLELVRIGNPGSESRVVNDVICKQRL